MYSARSSGINGISVPRMVCDEGDFIIDIEAGMVDYQFMVRKGPVVWSWPGMTLDDVYWDMLIAP